MDGTAELRKTTEDLDAKVWEDFGWVRPAGRLQKENPAVVRSFDVEVDTDTLLTMLSAVESEIRRHT